MDAFSNDTARWLERTLDETPTVECELGSLIAAASAWTEDEGELGDLVDGLIDTGRLALAIG